MNRDNLIKTKPASYSKSYMTADLSGIFRVTTVDCVISFWKLV